MLWILWYKFRIFQRIPLSIEISIPDLNGSSINFSGNYPDTVYFFAPFQLDTTWCAFDIDEIYFAAWLQSGLADKHVYQSENKTLAEVGIEEIFPVQEPSVFRIGNTFPNPFTSLIYIPVIFENSANISITIFDVSGREVRNLVTDKEFSQGSHEISWDGKNDIGETLSSGMYRVEVKSNDLVVTKFIVKI